MKRNGFIFECWWSIGPFKDFVRRGMIKFEDGIGFYINKKYQEINQVTLENLNYPPSQALYLSWYKKE